MDFIAIDFETANKNYNSACSLGMVFVENNEIIDEKYFLIHPPSLYFHPKNIEVHGIKPEDVKQERKFDEVWKEIGQYFEDNIIIAHNAYFDMSVLKACLETYNIDCPNFTYICSIPISNRATKGLKVGQSLKARCEHFQISLLNHHNALDDARACADLVIKSIQTQNRKSLQSFCQTYKSLPIKLFTELKVVQSYPTKKVAPRSFAPSIKISDLAPTTQEFDEGHPLFGKNFVFTGELQTIDRKEAMQSIIDLGAHVKSGVSKKTDYVVVGIQDQKIVGPNGMSTKETKAIDLIHAGANINIISEEVFLELLKDK
ncbi:exonuclease domain-containing protein [Bacillus massiliigorillae]|uniref:exonuclease domain-containing protein n=1 Tax=Bacillus massiliigorillae TaxID=1243664 RepID=UPI0003A00CFB|nr:exonuclease domain-containing protein [Bacillus massiliigorillae]